MSVVLVVAPHPDDETLGVGGTILRHIANGDDVHWCIVTAMHEAAGFTTERIEARDKTIASVAEHFGFAGVHQLGFAAAELDQVPRADLIGGFSEVISTLAAAGLRL